MPRRRKQSAPTEHNHTALEMKEWYEKNKNNIENFADSNEVFKKLRDVTKTQTRRVTTFSKDTLRTYLQNIGSNEANLRNLSRYLYYRSQIYYRLIRYFSNMLCLECYSIIPNIDLTKNQNEKAVLKNYNEYCDFMELLNIDMEMQDVMTICLLEDVYYGLVFHDDTGTFFYRIDPDYAKISGRYMTGDFSFSIDMSYFKRYEEVVEYLGEPLTSMYRAYGGVSAQRWQPCPDEFAVCIKANHEMWDLLTPPFVGLFNSLISLCDLEDIQAIADEQQIYKLIWMELETLTGAKDVNDWKVDQQLANRYFNKLTNEALPEYTAAAIVPGKLNTISFDNDQSTDTNKIQNSTKTVLNTSGGAQILNSASISGTTAFNAATKSDAQFVIGMFLKQIQAWTNRFATYYTKGECHVHFHEVSIFTKDEYKKGLLESAQYSLPTRLAYNTFNGFTEKDTLALDFLETNVLGLHEKFVYPLKSSYTASGNDAGAPTKDDADISDDGEASRDKTDRSNG